MIELLDRIEAARPRVLVVGDAMLDVYHRVAFQKKSAEADVPVYKERTSWSEAGGAAAVASMCHSLGARVTLACFAGGYVMESRESAALKREIGKIPGEHIFGFSIERTTVKHRHLGLSGDEQVLARLDEDPEFPYLRSFGAERFYKQFSGLPLKGAQAVLVADYAKGTINEDLIGLIAEASGDKPLLVDPARGVSWERYQGATVIKANDTEWGHASNYNVDPKWHERADWIVRTEGARGMCSIQRGGKAWHCHETEPIEPVDVTGCGDMVLAVLGVCLASGIELPDACRLANVAAGLKCRKLGAVPVSLAEIREALSVPA